jgi:hypothetical protein
MPSLLPEPLPTSHLPRRAYGVLLALVLALLLSCLAAFLLPFILIEGYDLIRPTWLRYLNEFPINQLEKVVIIPMLLIGASVGATVTHIIRWWLADTADVPWYHELGAVIKHWGIASVVLPILMFQIRSSFAELPWIGTALIGLVGAYTGHLIGRRHEQPALDSPPWQTVWIVAMTITWGIAWACVPSLIQAYIDQR